MNTGQAEERPTATEDCGALGAGYWQMGNHAFRRTCHGCVSHPLEDVARTAQRCGSFDQHPTLGSLAFAAEATKEPRGAPSGSCRASGMMLTPLASLG